MSAIGLLGVVFAGIGAVASIWIGECAEYTVCMIGGILAAAFDTVAQRS